MLELIERHNPGYGDLAEGWYEQDPSQVEGEIEYLQGRPLSSRASRRRAEGSDCGSGATTESTPTPGRSLGSAGAPLGMTNHLVEGAPKDLTAGRVQPPEAPHARQVPRLCSG
ncbi:MAG TPA: hypothetical protein VGE01_13350 [Fimbriimonas sp.]